MKLDFSGRFNNKNKGRQKSYPTVSGSKTSRSRLPRSDKYIMMIFDVGWAFSVKFYIPTIFDEDCTKIYTSFDELDIDTRINFSIFNITVKKYWKILEKIYDRPLRSVYSYTMSFYEKEDEENCSITLNKSITAKTIYKLFHDN